MRLLTVEPLPQKSGLKNADVVAELTLTPKASPDGRVALCCLCVVRALLEIRRYEVIVAVCAVPTPPSTGASIVKDRLELTAASL